MKKINGKQLMVIGYWLLVMGFFAVLVYSRFVNLSWGLPYPMHPDERNMANAIQSLNCEISNFKFQISNFKGCFNPHFFAYGQFPLYLGYFITYILKFFDGDLKFPISYEEAAISLRIISAVASIINTIIIIKIIKTITKKESFFLHLISLLVVTFSPYAIQFGHFGTTESLLMMLYSAIIYYSLLFIDKKISTSIFVVRSALLTGIALATKMSSLIFLAVPTSILLFEWKPLKSKTLVFVIYSLANKIIDLLILFFFSFVIFFIFSPHNFINFNDFISSMNYESDVALGRSLVFYTRQFFATTPFIFQFEKVFPYVLGWPVFIMGLIGFIGANWKDKKTNLLRFAFLIYFIPSAVIYAKWSRFMTPILPILTIFAILFLFRIKIINFIKIIIVIITIIPGVAYLHIYQSEDVRYQASNWIYNNVPNNSFILFETANVVDIPIIDHKSKIKDQKVVNKSYQSVSFNFYDLDISPQLQSDLKNYIDIADYIIVPSRRVFANHTCYINDKLQITNDKSITNNKCQILKQNYSILNQYYEDLFSGKLGFKKVAEFDSFPQINSQIKFPDEEAEETWTVFDHPVIRIYKKVKS